jgi:hypothetical protein
MRVVRRLFDLPQKMVPLKNKLVEPGGIKKADGDLSADVGLDAICANEHHP